MDPEYAPLRKLKFFSLVHQNPILGDAGLQGRPLLFHGVNKSGSLAFSRVFQSAYSRANLSDRFLCRYMQLPAGREDALKAFSERMAMGPLLIDHNLIGYEKRFPGTGVITMLRHPVRRFVSIYYWLSSRHPEKIMGRDILTWARQEHRAYAQLRQFAFDNSNPASGVAIDRKPLDEAIVAAIDYFEKYIVWWGICELFEESIVSFASLRGLKEIPSWDEDRRNNARPEYSVLPAKLQEALCEILGYDLAFYHAYRHRFLERFCTAEVKKSAEGYREFNISERANRGS